jgi:glycosyltransferase involved in cell wall biosynthesis
MKIAIDARELRGKPTGVGRFLGELLAAWKRLPEAQAHEFVPLAPEAADSMGGTLWEQMVLPARARDAGADVLFAPGYSGPLFRHMPMVVAIHDVSFAAHPDWFGWREGARRRTMVRLAARAATRVITISDFSKREIVAHLGIEAGKIAVIYPGISDLSAMVPRRPGNEGSSAATVLFVGSVFNRRHVPELIEGFSRLARAAPHVRLEIVGENRTSPYVDLESLVQASGLGDRIHLRSYVSDQELRSLYAASAAFVFLSEYEGFGLTPLEALASGLPVLLLDTPVAREVCGDAARYVPRADAALIEDGLRALLFDPGERERIGRDASHVLARYSWAACAARVLRVLLDAATRGRGPARSAPL